LLFGFLFALFELIFNIILQWKNGKYHCYMLWHQFVVSFINDGVFSGPNKWSQTINVTSTSHGAWYHGYD